MKMPSSSKHDFSAAPSADIPRSVFDRSHNFKTTFDADYLIPVMVDEVLPGDTFKLDLTAFARMSTPFHPLMDNIYLDTFFFFVPNRLVFEDWARLMGENTEGAGIDPASIVLPLQSYNVNTQPQRGSVSDYFGIPVEPGIPEVQGLPHRAYRLIWNEWFRDQNTQAPLPMNIGSTANDESYDVLLKRNKRHDYFTSALPYPQKGPDVTIGLGTGGVIPIVPSGDGRPLFDYTGSGGSTTWLEAIPAPSRIVATAFPPPVSSDLFWSDPKLEADASLDASFSINQFRESIQLQRMLERDARSGTRYTEVIHAHFGVRSPDSRLQRPEYLGGGSTPINMHTVPQTSATQTGVDESEQGNLAAYATAGIQNHGFAKSFDEHGFIIGLVNARADITYQQGLNRMWSRRERYDFYWPSFAHLGEQTVLNKEIRTTNLPFDEEVFGYQERYAEYRYKPSTITGKFRSDDPQSLDVWHLSEEFGNSPVLNSAFMTANTPMGRVLAIDTEPHFILDGWCKLKCARPMPLYAVPGYIDRF